MILLDELVVELSRIREELRKLSYLRKPNSAMLNTEMQSFFKILKLYKAQIERKIISGKKRFANATDLAKRLRSLTKVLNRLKDPSLNTDFNTAIKMVSKLVLQLYSRVSVRKEYTQKRLKEYYARS